MTRGLSIVPARLEHVDELMALLQNIFLTRPGVEWLQRLGSGCAVRTH